MDLIEIGINTRNWVDLAWDRDYWRALVNAPLNLWVPQAMELVVYMTVMYTRTLIYEDLQYRYGVSNEIFKQLYCCHADENHSFG